MGKFLQLKRCLAAAVIAFLGVTATWADATVVYEADMSQTNEPDGWKCYKPKDDKGTWTKEQITEKIWGYESNAEYNNVEVYISFIRRKLKQLNCKATINSIRGVGYSLEG